MSWVGRPKPGESEEELMKFQKEFFKNKIQPSAKLVKKSDTEPNVPSKTDTSASSPNKLKEDPMNAEGRAPQVLSNIRECTDVSTSKEFNTKGAPGKSKSLFAQRMENTRLGKLGLQNLTQSVNHSAPQFYSSDVNNSPKPTAISEKSEANIGDHSFIITGKEASEIHQQNVNLLANLSVQEIEAERQRLLSQLTPGSIDFLLSRRKAVKSCLPSEDRSCLEKKEDQGTFEKMGNAKGKIFDKAVSATMETMTETENSCPGHVTDSLPIDPREAKQWLHMDVVESDKLEWMKDVPITTPKPDEPYAARFDFQGMLLPYVDEKLEEQGLHHHGDEPQRPGYTLQELMQLSRSSVQQQRILGLSTIAYILQKVKMGLYDTVLDQNLMQQLLDAGLFLLLRFSMDDIAPPVIIAALGAMRNLLCNEPDEASLDFMLGCEGGLLQPTLPCLSVDTNQHKSKRRETEEAELKDYKIIELDVLKGAQRTNLIVRLGYILDVVKGPPDAVLDLLIRITRHSQELAMAVASCGGLLATIRDQFITSRVMPQLAAGFGQPGYGEPSVKALKLMRVLAARSRTFANTLVDKLDIMEPVMTYVSMSSPELPHIQGLVIGGFYLWQTLMSYGLALHSVIDLFPILMRQLHYHAQLTSAVGEQASAPGHELATALVGVVEKLAETLAVDQNQTPPFDEKPVFQLAKLIVECLYKWLTQMSSTNEKPMWSSVKMIGASLRCLAVTAKSASTMGTSDAISFRQKLESLSFNFVIPFLKSKVFQHLTKNLKSCSYLLSKGCAVKKRDPENLPSLRSVEWGGENLVPTLLPHSSHPLLAGLAQYMISSRDICGVPIEKYEAILLRDSSLQVYIQDLSCQPLRFTDNWFARQELYLLHHIVSLAVSHPTAVANSSRVAYLRLAFRISTIIQSHDKHLVGSFLPLTVLSEQFLRWGGSNTPDATVDSKLLNDSIARLAVIRDVYCNVLGIKHLHHPHPSVRSSLTSQPRGAEPALPTDWQFAPLLLLYSQHNSRDRARILEDDAVNLVKSCLQFLLIVESLCCGATDSVSVTARWCRLALVFISGSDLFLDGEVEKLVQANLYLLLRKNDELDFQEEIPGLSSFYDLYTELLLQFSSLSYGNTLFGAFILIPLQQKQDPQLRRMVWGEHASIMRFLGTNIEEVGVPMKAFLYPCETDPTLLMPYLEFIARGHLTRARCPVLFAVAIHHVSAFVMNNVDLPFACKLQSYIEHLGNKEVKELFNNYKVPASTNSDTH